MTMMQERTWIDVCGYDDLQSELGTRVLVGDEHVAVFRTHEGAVHAISAIDPFSGASVLSRGIVGSCGDAPFVASPMYKQRFDLRTGVCLEDPSVQVRVFTTEVTGGRVVVASP
jgi:nitrite reductase (NADH) small subunit